MQALSCKKLLNLREKIKEAKEILYHEFSVLDEWKTNFRSCLMRYILQLSNPSQQRAEELPAEASQPQPAAGLLLTEEEDLGEGKKQVIEIMGTITQMMAQKKGPSNLSSFHTARLFLIASTLMEQYSSELPGTHEINLLYKNKEQLKTTPAERLLLFRTVMHDIYDVIPGWFFLREPILSQKESARMIFDIALHDENLTIQKNVRELLESARIVPPEDDAPEMLISILQENDGPTRRAGLSYFKSVTSLEVVTLVEQYLKDHDPDLLPDAELIGSILATRKDPEAALAATLRGGTEITEEFRKEIGKKVSDLSVTLLKEAGLHTDHWIRLLAIEELFRRKTLTKEEISAFIMDPSPAIKAAAYRELIQLGTEFEPEQIRNAFKSGPPPANALSQAIIPPYEDDLILELFRRYPIERLRQLIDWYSVNGKLHTEPWSKNILKRLPPKFAPI